MNFSSKTRCGGRFVGMLLAGALCGAQAQEAGGTVAAPADAAQVPIPASVPVSVTPPSSRSSSGSSSAQLSEVVVTATKRATPVRSIPATITVLNGEDLERQGIQSLDEIVALVPGVSVDNTGTGGDAARVTIRGISAGSGTNLTAGTLIGDTPFSDPFLPKVQLDPNPFDMATVEVLKGPQGTLFGGTGLNGMLRYVPQAPELDRYRVKYFTQFTDYPGTGGSGWTEGGAVNVPFAGHTAAVRVMGFYRDEPGYVDSVEIGLRDANSIGQYGFRLMLDWHPDQDWNVSLMGITQRTQYNDIAYTDGKGQWSRDTAPRTSPQTAEYSLGNLGVQRSFSWADLISQTSVFEKRYDAFIDASRAADGGQIPLLGGADYNRSEGLTQEFRLVSSPSQEPWKWLAGAFLFDERLFDCADIGAAEGLPSLPSIPLPVVDEVLATPCEGNVQKLTGTLDIDKLIGDVKLREEALFGEVTRELGHYWDVTLGTRAYRTQSSGTVSFGGALYVAEHPTGADGFSAGLVEHGLSPKASIIFHPTRDFRTYVTASRGFRFGGPQLALPDPTATNVPNIYKSDSLWNYEWGFRTDWLRRTLRFDASLYHIQWKNPQVYQLSATGLTNYITNVGGAKGNGADMELILKPRFLYGMSLTEAASWNRTVTSEQFASSTGATIPAGSPWPLAPHWQTSTTLAYELSIRSWALSTSLRHTYWSAACNTIDCTAQVFGFHMLDYNLALTPQEDSEWPQISLSLKNLTNARAINDFQPPTSAGMGTGVGNAVTYFAPRAVVLRLSGQF